MGHYPEVILIPNNYKVGYECELRSIKDITAKGYACIRSSGSHTPIDIVAIPNLFDGNNPKVLCIQVKSTSEKMPDKYNTFHPYERNVCEMAWISDKYRKTIHELQAFYENRREIVYVHLWVWLRKLEGRKAHWVKYTV
jgi:hypothetical protein